MKIIDIIIMTIAIGHNREDTKNKRSNRLPQG